MGLQRRLLKVFKRFKDTTPASNEDERLIGTTATTAPAPTTAKMSSPSPSAMVPQTQRILLLHGPRQPYKLVEDYPVPKLQGDSEVLVKTNTIGLNPIDWKAP